MMSIENQRNFSRKEMLKTAAKAGAYFALAGVPLSVPLALAFGPEKKESESEENHASGQSQRNNDSVETNNLTPTSTTKPVSLNTSTSEALITRPETGKELIDSLGLGDKVVYLVYGRPLGWGSLRHTRTAEESWQFYQTRKASVSEKISLKQEDFALNIINPVQDNDGYGLSESYIKKALELCGDQRQVAFDFRNLDLARETINHFETFLSKEALAHLAITLDAEWFPGSQIDAQAINQFAVWFAKKHQEWAGEENIPGLVFIYVFSGSKIVNLSKLNQYYPDQKTLVVPLFDGQGTKRGKLYGMGGLVQGLRDTEAFPALVGVMEFREEHGDTYDQCTVKQSFETLKGAPVYFFASQ
jgi:hypothetical protein